MGWVNRFLLPCSSIALLVSALGAAPASAACVGPSITVQPDTVRPGQTATVTGADFADGPCNDTITDPPTPTIPNTPARGMGIAFVHAGRSTTLTTVDADASFAFTAAITIPNDATPGPATIEVVGRNASTSIVVADRPTTLPRTGVGTDVLTVAGLSALLLGALVLSSGARRALDHR